MNNKSFNIANKIIIVTGAAGFLGSGYVQALLSVGANVAAWDLNAEALSKLKKICGSKKYNGSLLIQQVDVTKEIEVEKAVKTLVKKYGRIDAVINNAAMNAKASSPESANQFVPYEQYSIDLFRQEIDANLVGPMIVMKYVSPVMISQKSGSIVNIASEVSTIAHDHRVYATEGKYKSPAYTASKAGILGLTRQFAARLGEHNVRVNALSIGGVRKETQSPEFAKRFGATTMLGRMANPGEYSATIIYLCSDASSFMTGANLIIDGGKSAW